MPRMDAGGSWVGGVRLSVQLVPLRLLLLNFADLQVLWQVDVTFLGRPE